MTITSTDPRIQYSPSVSTTAFAVPFVFYDDTDLKVYVGTTLMTITTEYSVTGGDGSGGTVTLVTAVSSGTVTIVRDIPISRTTDFPGAGPFEISTLNEQLDKIFAILQQLDDVLDRTVRESNAVADGLTLTLPSVATRADKFLCFDDDGNITVAEAPASATAGYKVKVSGTDSDPDYLTDKVTVAGLLTKATSGSGDESLDFNVPAAAVADFEAGTSTTKALTPKALVDGKASQAEAEAGTNATHWMTPERSKQQLDALGLQQGVRQWFIPASAMISRSTNGAGGGVSESSSNKVMLVTADFDQSTQEFAQWIGFFPKSWNAGTITARSVWTASAGSALQTFDLAVQGVAISDDDVIDAAFGTEQVCSDALIATGDIHVSAASAAITIAGSPAANDLIVLQFKRNVSTDNLAADAKLIGVIIEYTLDDPNDA